MDALKKNPHKALQKMSEDEIASILAEADDHYYNSDAPLFSDEIYDIIRETLANINPNHPALSNVGAAAGIQIRTKEKLPFHMGSLDKIKTDPKAISDFVKNKTGNYVISDKLDGNSALVHYDGTELKLFTRGDGTVGQNISHLNPLFFNKIKKTKPFTARGELIISRQDFEKIKHRGANGRNMVAGFINSKTPDKELSKYVHFVAYELIIPVMSPEKQMKELEKMKFETVYHTVVNSLTSDSLSEFLIDRRKNSPYEVDGIVVAHNEVVPKNTTGNPTHMFAFKSLVTMDKAEVVVTGVEWNISKDGYFKPVVLFLPVNLAGVSIKRASGFNGKYILENEIGPGSKIIITRSGDVIPHILEIVTRTKASMPDADYVFSSTGVDIMVASVDDDPTVKCQSLISFFDKINVPGMSTGTVTLLFNNGYDTVKKIINIKISNLLAIDGIKQKKADNIFNALHERFSQGIDHIDLMDASNKLGRGIGKKKLEPVLLNFPTLLEPNTKNWPNVEGLTLIKGIEKKTATLILESLPGYFKFIKDNDIKIREARGKFPEKPRAKSPEKSGEQSGEKPREKSPNKSSPKKEPTSIGLEGKIVVFSGFRDTKLEEIIKNGGGAVMTSVSKNTSMVLIKSHNDKKPGSKVEKALQLNKDVISLDEFIHKYSIKN